jgi:hypothetical protein
MPEGVVNRRDDLVVTLRHDPDEPLGVENFLVGVPGTKRTITPRCP